MKWYSVWRDANSTTLTQGKSRPCAVDGTPLDKDAELLFWFTETDWNAAVHRYDGWLARVLPYLPE